MREWFDDDECGTPDTWGKKIVHVDSTGMKTVRVLVHLHAADRNSNHELFVKLRGQKCTEICTEALKKAGRKMIPRIPSATVLENCRPNYAKYFKKTGYGECSTCKPAYENYAIFASLCRELKDDIKLPATVSEFVRQRVCRNTVGENRHECEDNNCKDCSFTNYFITDNSLTSKQKSSACSRSFSEENGIQFILDSILTWKELVTVGDSLPGGRKYDHLLYKFVEGTVEEFLLVFQRQCSRLKPHKHYQHACSLRKSLSKMDDNSTLQKDVIAIFADYSQNFKKRSGRTGVNEQYRDAPDASLLNLNCFIRVTDHPIRLDYHCISDDPKHDSCLWPPSLLRVAQDMLAKFPRTKHIEITTDTSKKEFKSVSVFKRVTDISIKLKRSFMVCTFGPGHGKFLYDGSGRVWEDYYAKNCVGRLGVGADNLKKVAVFMNDHFSTPATKSSDISQRKTIVIPPESHTLSKYTSIPRTTCNFCFYISPGQPDGVHVRRY